MSAPIVFFDIAGPDVQVLHKFYSEIFQWNIGADHRFAVSVAPQMKCVLRQDPAERVIYVGVDDVAVKLKEIEAQGGKIDVPRFAVPGVVVMGLFKDPAGNRVGLVEMHNGQAKIP